MVYRLKKIKALKTNLPKVTDEAGIYVFWDKNMPIYIGKSISLRNRLNSYFAAKLETKTAQMMSKACYFSVVAVTSEIEALLLEATLVRKHKPRFNIALKDDKHPLYIMITNELYPRVITVRKPQLGYPSTDIYGPFPSSANVKSVLKILRDIFPYATHLPGKRPCLYRQMDLCKPCPSEIVNTKGTIRRQLTKEYTNNVRNIRGILSGRFKNVRRGLEMQMQAFARNQMYESAHEIKEKIDKLDYITNRPPSVSRFMENPNLLEDTRRLELDALTCLLRKYLPIGKLNRIECFDVTHTAGVHPTASMVTFIGGVPEKSYYRHFQIKKAKGGNDTDSLSEIAKRRSKRLNDWGRPDLIIADGGKTQTKVFVDEFAKFGVPVVGLAKRFETLVIPKDDSFVMIRPKGGALSLVQRIRDEAHRFARRYHHKLFKDYLFADHKH